MNESGYIRSVNKYLPDAVYHWKIATQFNNGIPDCYYSGNTRDLWIEWKYVRTTRKLPDSIKPALSTLQNQWLNKRLTEGRNVAVIVGTDHGCLLFLNKAWERSKSTASLLSKKECASWIENFCSAPVKNH